MTTGNYKVGNEFLPYHPNASHCPPDYREGWNNCFSRAQTRITELEAQLEATKWQPIETAPNDHFSRLFRVNGFVVQGFLDATGELFVQPNGGLPRKMKGTPDEWMPLPSPPIDAAIQTKEQA